MPQWFKESGYWTGAVGKVFHNPQNDPGDLAWDEYRRFGNDEMPMVTPIRKKFEAEHGSIARGKARKKWREFYPTIAKQTRGQHVGYGPSGLTDEQHMDGKNARQVAAWLEDHSHGEQPFFIACGIQKPHVPFLAPDKYFDLTRKTSCGSRPRQPVSGTRRPRMAIDGRYRTFGFVLGVENDSAPPRVHAGLPRVCLLHRRPDRAGARCAAGERALGRHGRGADFRPGYQLGEHFMWGKVTLFEVCDRVPLVVRAPGRTQPGSSSTGLVELVDLFPTLAELSGAAAPEGLQGRSLAPMLSAPAKDGKETAYTVVSRQKKLGRAIRTDRWRYASWPDGEELYDLRDDPAEHTNLASSSQHQATLRRMRTHLGKTESRAAAARPSAPPAPTGPLAA